MSRTPNIPLVDLDLAAYEPDRLAYAQLGEQHRAEMHRLGLASNLDVVGPDALQALQLARILARESIPESRDWCADDPEGCEGNLGLYRNQMPQISDKSAAKLAESTKARERAAGHAILLLGGPKGNKTVLQDFLDHFTKMGVRVRSAQAAVGGLKATQREIQTKKAYEMADAYLHGKFGSLPSDTVVVSQDWHLLDGHHRWAALLTIDPTRLMQVIQIDAPIREILLRAAAFRGVYAANLEGDVMPDNFQKRYKSQGKASLRAFEAGRKTNPVHEHSSSRSGYSESPMSKPPQFHDRARGGQVPFDDALLVTDRHAAPTGSRHTAEHSHRRDSNPVHEHSSSRSGYSESPMMKPPQFHDRARGAQVSLFQADTMLPSHRHAAPTGSRHIVEHDHRRDSNPTEYHFTLEPMSALGLIQSIPDSEEFFMHDIALRKVEGNEHMAMCEVVFNNQVANAVAVTVTVSYGSRVAHWFIDRDGHHAEKGTAFLRNAEEELQRAVARAVGQLDDEDLSSRRENPAKSGIRLGSIAVGAALGAAAMHYKMKRG